MEKDIFADQETARIRFDDLKKTKDFVQLYKRGDQYIVFSDEQYILLDEHITSRGPENEITSL